MSATLPLTRQAVFAQAWPIMLGQASIPLVGIVDTIVIGRTGDAVALAGVALGAMIINLIFWSFGFLRMGMTGLTAQADGSGERDEVDALLLRGLIIGGTIGLALLVLQFPLSQLAFALLAGGEGVTAEASDYVTISFFGAPAALAVFAITGWMFGLGKTRHALALQVVMNVTNIALDVWLVWGLDMGVRGVAIGTMAGQWVALAAGIILASHLAGFNPVALARKLGKVRLLDPAAIRKLFEVNRDIMIRTIALLLMFTWFTNAGARLGATTLAANHVLMQFVSVAAFVLDAFAFTAESRVGNAIGARSRPQFLRAIRLTSEFCLCAGVALALLFWFGGGLAIEAITTDPQVRAIAGQLLPFAAAVPLLGVLSWMLDGIFIGATRGKALRNAAIAATTLYVGVDILLRPLGTNGVWIALLIAYLLRAAALGLAFPSLMRSLDGPKARNSSG
jgi:MATE family multidrug resistance protein